MAILELRNPYPLPCTALDRKFEVTETLREKEIVPKSQIQDFSDFE